MTLNSRSLSMVKENTPSKEPSSAQGHSSKLQLSDGSSIYAKLVVIENLLACYVAILQIMTKSCLYILEAFWQLSDCYNIMHINWCLMK